MRITQGMDHYAVLDITESDALDTVSKMIRQLEKGMKNGKKDLVFDNFEGYRYPQEELERIIQLFDRLIYQDDIDYFSKNEKAKRL